MLADYAQPRFNYRLVLSILLFLFSVKLLRLLPFPGFQLLWNAHIFLLLAVYFLMLMHLFKFFKNNLDYFVFAYISVAMIIVVLPDGSGAIKSFVYFILPLSCYYIGRSFLFSIPQYYNLIRYLSFVLLFMYFLDFFLINFTTIEIIDYGFFREVSASMGRVSEEMNDYKVHPILGQKLLRTAGVSMSPHSTSVLYASLAVFFFSFYKKNKLKNSLFLFVIFSLIVVSYNVSTGVLVYFILMVFSLEKRWLTLFTFVLFPLLTVGLAYLTYGEKFLPILNQVGSGMYLVYIKPLLDLEPFYVQSFLFGTGMGVEGDPIRLLFEVDFIDIFFQLGLFVSILLVLIIIQFYRTINFLNKFIFLKPYAILVSGLIWGSIHYQSMFRYPNVLLIFFIIGFVSKIRIFYSKKNIEV